MNNKDKDDMMLEILGMISNDGLDEFLKDLPGESSYPFAISNDFETKIMELLEEKRREERRSLGFKNMRKIAAAVIFVTAIGFLTIAPVDAFRTPVLRFFLNQHDNTMDIVGENQEYIPAVVVPGYIPKGFRFIETVDNDGFKISKFADKKNTILIYQMDFSMVIRQDIEYRSGEHRKIDGLDYYVHEEDGKFGIVFQRYNYIIRLTGELPEAEMMAIAESF